VIKMDNLANTGGPSRVTWHRHFRSNPQKRRRKEGGCGRRGRGKEEEEEEEERVLFAIKKRKRCRGKAPELLISNEH